MKTYYASLITAACIQPVFAQTVVEEVVIPAPPREVVIERGTPDVPPPLRPDPAIAKRQRLSILPRDAVIPVYPPGTVVETTETTHSVDVPGQPRRIYNVERNVVVVEGKELPYITLPVLFVKETAELLDAESRATLQETAAEILEILKTQPTAVFDIEGHTSTDGTDEFNIKLSTDRALRILEELTRRYSIPTAALSGHGYGETYAKFPNGNEEQMVLDRRVLVVRKK
jgi:outer membrane protein OmpA-like peptidoglycan-associated protein